MVKARVEEICNELTELAVELGKLDEGPMHAIIIACVIARVAEDDANGKLIVTLAKPCADFLIAMKQTYEVE